MNDELAAELARMVAEDQRIRQAAKDSTEFARRLTVEERMQYARIDVANTDRLRAIVARHGWPGRSLVGAEGADAAWLLAQHADRQLGFQREALVLLAEAVATDEAERRHLAYLSDRVRMNEGREQLYATQVGDIVEGTPIPWPIEDREAVDDRRAAMGLDSLAVYLREFAGPDRDG